MRLGCVKKKIGLWTTKFHSETKSRCFNSTLKTLCQHCLEAKEENYIGSDDEKRKEQKGKLYTIIYSYVVAMFWLLAALNSLDLKKKSSWKSQRKNSKHDGTSKKLNKG